jgi:formate/nitrite transporter
MESFNSSGGAVLDALLPAEMAEKAERAGVQKTRLDTPSLLVLATLAGAFIAFGAMFSTIVVAAADGSLPYGVMRLLAGLVFSMGLILVVVGGAELFTGNNLMVMAWASGRVGIAEMLRAWTLVYVGNFIGAVATAALVFVTEDYSHGDGAVGAAALAIAESKASLPFLPALVHGVLGNVLVCLAVWLCYSARTTTDRILAIVPPVSAFVAAGFEHSVANMYLIPYGLLIKHFAPQSFWTDSGATPGEFPALTIAGMIANLVPVTIGNVIGGGLLVGAVYWFVYLRRRRPPPGSA